MLERLLLGAGSWSLLVEGTARARRGARCARPPAPLARALSRGIWYVVPRADSVRISTTGGRWGSRRRHCLRHVLEMSPPACPRGPRSSSAESGRRAWMVSPTPGTVPGAPLRDLSSSPRDALAAGVGMAGPRAPPGSRGTPSARGADDGAATGGCARARPRRSPAQWHAGIHDVPDAHLSRRGLNMVIPVKVVHWEAQRHAPHLWHHVFVSLNAGRACTA